MPSPFLTTCPRQSVYQVRVGFLVSLMAVRYMYSPLRALSYRARHGILSLINRSVGGKATGDAMAPTWIMSYGSDSEASPGSSPARRGVFRGCICPSSLCVKYKISPVYPLLLAKGFQQALEAALALVRRFSPLSIISISQQQHPRPPGL